MGGGAMDGLVRAALGAGRQDSSNIVLDEFAIYILRGSRRHGDGDAI